MFTRKMERVQAGTALASGRRIVEPCQVVRQVGERVQQMLWPATGTVDVTSSLPCVMYDDDEFWCIMENLVGRALSSGASSGRAGMVMVGARRDGSTTLFSVHTPAPRAFSREGVPDGSPGSPTYRVCDAKAVVESNGGRFWLDDRNGSGSTAYFTIPG